MMNKFVDDRKKTPGAMVAACTDLRVLLMLGCFAASAVVTYAVAPDWWATRGITKPGSTANDYSVANQGQLKNMARAACDEMLAKGYIDTSHSIYQQVQSWRANTANAKDYGAVNLGQLKAVAKPFYDVLKARDSVINYPWSSVTTDDKDYAMANIGQLKSVFSFGIPDILNAPASLRTSLLTSSSVRLAWLDTNTEEDGYRIERSADASTFAPVGTTAANAVAFTDTGLADNTDYYYRVVAFHLSAVSLPSVVHIKTLLDSDHDGIPDYWETWSLSNNGNEDGDVDEFGNPVPNYKDANPFDSSVGEMTITITAPGNSTTF